MLTQKYNVVHSISIDKDGILKNKKSLFSEHCSLLALELKQFDRRDE